MAAAATVALLSCARGPARTGARAASPAAAVDWSYEVEARDPRGTELAITGTFGPSVGRARIALQTDDDATPFVRDVETLDRGTWKPVPAADGVWEAPCRDPPCRVRYRFALGEAASAINAVDTAAASGGVLIAPPSTWLLRPSDDERPPRERTFRFFVRGVPFATGLHSESDGSFFGPASTIDSASFAVFGPFRSIPIASGHAVVDLVIAPEGIGLPEASLHSWVKEAVDSLSDYYGAFPVLRSLVVLVPGTAASTEGETLGDGGGSVVIRTAAPLTAAKVRDDWVVVHELIHVTLPSLDRGSAWLSEGIATYVEPIVRARAGLVGAEQYWRDLAVGLPQGLPAAGDQGLARTHTWGRTYWGGALFCLLADVRIREQTAGRRSFDDVLRHVAAMANVETHWTIEKFLDEGDRATGSRILHDLYAEMGLAPGITDLGPLWRRLGVKPGPAGRMAFDDAAPLAAIRRAILEPARSKPAATDRNSAIDEPPPKG